MLIHKRKEKDQMESTGGKIVFAQKRPNPVVRPLSNTKERTPPFQARENKVPQDKKSMMQLQEPGYAG
jgi:hypothetical protein